MAFEGHGDFAGGLEGVGEADVADVLEAVKVHVAVKHVRGGVLVLKRAALAVLGIFIAGAVTVDEGEAGLVGAFSPGVAELEDGGVGLLLELLGTGDDGGLVDGEDGVAGGGAVVDRAELVHELDAVIPGTVGVELGFDAQACGVKVLDEGLAEGGGDAAPVFGGAGAVHVVVVEVGLDDLLLGDAGDAGEVYVEAGEVVVVEVGLVEVVVVVVNYATGEDVGAEPL